MTASRSHNALSQEDGSAPRVRTFGLAPNREQRRQDRSACADLDVLERWIEEASVASSAEEAPR